MISPACCLTLLKRRFLSAGLVFTWATSSCFAGEAIAPDIINSQLRQIQSLSFTATRLHESSSIPTAEIVWSETAEGAYHYNYRGFHDSGERFSSERSYDLNAFMDFIEEDSYLFVRPENREIASEVQNMLLILAPWDYLGALESQNFWKKAPLKHLLDMASNADVIRPIETVGEEIFNGESCVHLRVLGGASRFYETATSYDIFLSKESLLPIAWIEKDAAGRTLSKLVVQEMQKISAGEATFSLPRKIHISYFNPANDHTIETPINSLVFVYSDVSVNAVSSQEMVIDPSKARKIYDTATQTVIDVPKLRAAALTSDDLAGLKVG